MLASGSHSASTLSVRAWHAWVQAEKSVIDVFSIQWPPRFEIDQGAVFKYFHLLLGFAQLLSAIMQQRCTALVCGERGLEWQLARLHFADNGFQFRESGFIVFGRGGGAGFGHELEPGRNKAHYFNKFGAEARARLPRISIIFMHDDLPGKFRGGMMEGQGGPYTTTHAMSYCL